MFEYFHEYISFLGWIAILFGIPLFFALKCCAIIIGTPILCTFGSISGPFLAFVIPAYMMAYNHSNPIEMWTNARRSLKEGYKICKEIDKWTAGLSFAKVMMHYWQEVLKVMEIIG